MSFPFLKRSILSFLLVALTVLWVASAIFSYSSRVDVLKLAQTENDNLSDALSAYTELAFGSIASRLKEIAENFPADTSFAPLDPKITKLLGEWALNTKGVSSLNIFSDDGTMIQSGIISKDGKIYAPEKLFNFRERSYVRYFTENWTSSLKNELFIGDPVISKVTKRWIVPIAYPRASSENTFPGLAVTAMEIQDFMGFFKTSVIQDQTVAISHINGTLMLRLPRSEGLIGKNFSHGVLFTKYLRESQDGHYEAKVVTEGTTRLISYRKVKGFPLVVIVSKLKETVLKEWQRQTFALAGLVILLSFSLGYYSRRVRGQANILEENEYNLREQVEVRTQEYRVALVEAERANNAKSNFLASMSHELRTPLNAVLGFAQLLQLDPNNPLTPKQSEYVDNVLEGGNHLLELVGQVLDLATIEANQVSISLAEVNAIEVANDCLELMSPLAKPMNIKVINKLSKKRLPLLRTDKIRFKQVLINLLANAIKFNKEGGSVTLDAQQIEGDFLRITVADTGIGIAEDSYFDVFKIFNRLGSDPMVTKEGTGIGLPVSKMLIERLSGRVGFDSDVGVGSTFWIELPLTSCEDVLIWADNFRIGVDAIDADHQKLFTLTNRLSYDGLDDDALNDIFGELVSYTHYHFKREETIMETCGYPDLEAHHNLHIELASQVKILGDEWLQTGNTETLIKLRRFMRNWLISHVVGEDAKIAQFTNGKEQDIKSALRAIKVSDSGQGSIGARITGD